MASLEQDLVSVFRTQDAALLPLAEITLRKEQIEYMVRRTTGDVRHALAVGVTDFNHPLDTAEILVVAADARRARDLLADLENPMVTSDLQVSPSSADWETPPIVVHLADAQSAAPLGDITEEQLQVLVDALEEESPSSQSYYVDEVTLEVLEEAGADRDLLRVLKRALGSRQGIQIRWER